MSMLINIVRKNWRIVMVVYTRSRKHQKGDKVAYQQACAKLVILLRTEAGLARTVHEDLTDYRTAQTEYEETGRTYIEYPGKLVAWEAYRRDVEAYESYPQRKQDYQHYQEQSASWQEKQQIAAGIQQYCEELEIVYRFGIVSGYFVQRADQEKLRRFLGIKDQDTQNNFADEGQVYLYLSNKTLSQLIQIAEQQYNEVYDTLPSFSLEGVLKELGEINSQQLKSLKGKFDARQQGQDQVALQRYAIALLGSVILSV